VIDHIPNYHTKIVLRDINAKWEERIFSSRQSGIRVYIRIVMIMVLE